jgi:hypothetical protein
MRFQYRRGARLRFRDSAPQVDEGRQARAATSLKLTVFPTIAARRSFACQ